MMSRRFFQNREVILGLLGLGLLLVSALSLGMGAVSITSGEILVFLQAKLTGAPVDGLHDAVIYSIRAPRILFGALVGATLGVAGAGLQGIFRNPLADPGLIGVTSGAALAVATTMILLPATGVASGILGELAIPLGGFLGGLAVTALVYRLATSHGKTEVTTMLLAGIAINAFAGAGLGLLVYISDDNQLRDFTMWTLGGLGGTQWKHLYIAAPVGLIALGGLLVHWRALNAMLLGESEAFHLGIDADGVKKRVVFFAALAVGATVGYAGMIGFVGLVVPHLLRLLGGADHRFVLPGSALLGALLLVGADSLARTIAAPAEIPIGILTALVGAPFFLWLLLRQRQRGFQW